MRRYAPVILFLFVLIVPLVLGKLCGTAPEKSSAGPEVVIVTANVEGIRREFSEAFSTWHAEHFGTPANVVYLNYGGSADTVKFFRNSQETTFKSLGTYKIDLIWGGGDYLFRNQLADFLDPASLPDETMRFAFPNPTLNGIELYDTKRHAWYGTTLASFGICYNKDVCKMLDVAEPKTWSDLADALGELAVAGRPEPEHQRGVGVHDHRRARHDRRQGAGQNRRRRLGPRHGRDSPDRVEREDFTESGSEVPSIVGIGDAGAGMVIDFYGRSQVEAVGADRMAYLEPAGATAINPDPIALVKGAEHRDEAIRFIEFVLSEQGQRLWNTRAGARRADAEHRCADCRSRRAFTET